MKKVMQDIFSQLMFNILKNCVNFIMAHYFYQKVEKLVADLAETEYIIHIRNLKEALNRRLVLKKFPKVVKFKQNAQLKPYIDMNTDIRKKAKHDFKKDFFKKIDE